MIPLFWVDAFSERPFAGNPAAVCLLEEPASEPFMQSVATELGISETAFVWPLADGSLSLRWFTPACEVDLCGHATVAAAHALRQAGRCESGEVLRFTTRAGVLTARFVGDDRALVELDFPAQPCDQVPLPVALAAIRDDAHGVGDNGDFLVVELAHAAAVRDFVPDLGAISSLDARGMLLTAPGGPEGADYVLRHFAPRFGIDEDPVTGSAQCALGPWWAVRLGRDVLQAVQLSARGGRLRVQVDGDRVRIAGGAVTVLAGELAVKPS